MPAPSPKVTKSLEDALRKLGERIRNRRKELGVSAIATAEAAGISRITLHRIERGEVSVAMGAYLSVIDSLGLTLDLTYPQAQKRKQKSLTSALPKKIRLANYKQLKRLAWQLKDTKEITPKEALDLYERNWRHVDVKKMDTKEKRLLENLLVAFGRERLLV